MNNLEINKIYDNKDYNYKGIKQINVNDIDSSFEDMANFLENVNESIVVNMPELDIVLKILNIRNTYQGFNRSIINYVKKIVNLNVNSDDLVVDMTVGNGFDTLFLSNIVKNGMVFGFDIQDEAIKNTRCLLDKNNCKNYKLINDSHANVDIYLKEYVGKIKLFLFNLGYLPGGDKTIKTNYKSTLKAFIKAYNMLAYDGLIMIVFYPHPEGIKESVEIISYLNNNSIKYREYRNTSNINAPFLVVVEKI